MEEGAKETVRERRGGRKEGRRFCQREGGRWGRSEKNCQSAAATVTMSHSNPSAFETNKPGFVQTWPHRPRGPMRSLNVAHVVWGQQVEGGVH